MDEPSTVAENGRTVSQQRSQTVLEDNTVNADMLSLFQMSTLIVLRAFGLGQLTLEQPEVSVTGTREKSAIVSCKVSSKDFSKDYIHWYRQKPDQGLEQLLYVSTAPAQSHLGGTKNKLEAKNDVSSSTSTLKISFLEKDDEAMYYCAGWVSSNHCDSSIWIKVFGEGTKVVVIPPDRRLDGDLFPKPTIFFPSVEEVKLHMAGTHLCLLQKFFPDAIKVQWKEKNGNTILESQQGDIIKTNDTYMKFSWLTLTKKAMDKEHVCIVKHENNKGGRDQEILFSSVNKVVATTKPPNDGLKDKSDRNLATDISPKPTIFLPSIAEINHSKTGTYLSLLEKFFPDIIEVYWKEKDGNRALPSQKGNTMKTTDTYMKFSWLTVAENSMDKEHICVVKHERNIGGINQEILFPSINEEVTGTGSKKDCLKDESEVTADHNSTKVCLKDESNTLQLQLMNTSAYYTYLLLLLKSAVYFIITTSCVFRRTGVCCDGKNL
ncbi:unnamed protein product [Rangifer tarandus platyrhynchus]|uniref:Ig-like domain-containing protein n=1 Tax=Rangifer tarandus platyrhynchus TaxID=3082113 RepID=A0ABN8YHQ3_RANTA|nr:unnamed protein product [Rangifer tarandus platyrhynchus]